MSDRSEMSKQVADALLLPEETSLGSMFLDRFGEHSAHKHDPEVVRLLAPYKVKIHAVIIV